RSAFPIFSRSSRQRSELSAPMSSLRNRFCFSRSLIRQKNGVFTVGGSFCHARIGILRKLEVLERQCGDESRSGLVIEHEKEDEDESTLRYFLSSGVALTLTR